MHVCTTLACTSLCQVPILPSSLPLVSLQGEFLQTFRARGFSYGLTMAAIEQVAQQGLACITHMSIEVT